MNGGAPLHKKSRWDWGLVLSSHDMKRGSCKRMNKAGKENSCWGEGGLLLQLIFAENKSEGIRSPFGVPENMDWETVSLRRDLMVVL